MTFLSRFSIILLVGVSVGTISRNITGGADAVAPISSRTNTADVTTIVDHEAVIAAMSEAEAPRCQDLFDLVNTTVRVAKLLFQLDPDLRPN